MRRLKNFTFEGKRYRLIFMCTETLPGGTVADIYDFVGNDSMDLAIFRTETRTPLQKVLKGERTVEGYLSGNGELTIIGTTGQSKTYRVGKGGRTKLQVDVKVGEMMRWNATKGSFILGYEVCMPKWDADRYYDIEY